MRLRLEPGNVTAVRRKCALCANSGSDVVSVADIARRIEVRGVKSRWHQAIAISRQQHKGN